MVGKLATHIARLAGEVASAVSKNKGKGDLMETAKLLSEVESALQRAHTGLKGSPWTPAGVPAGEPPAK
jgi:hypothetical protein